MIDRVPQATFWRLPAYLRYLERRREEGMTTITSTVIAEGLGLNSIQVRKDLAMISSVRGKPKTGFGVAELINDLNAYLGYDNISEAVLVGAGGLGSALLSYSGFEKYGLRIVGAFDTSAARIGTAIGAVTVRDVLELSAFVAAHKILLGIVTVPKAAAQAVTDALVAAGIRAIWNFAPAHLVTPEGITVRDEDMAGSLAMLAKSLRIGRAE